MSVTHRNWTWHPPSEDVLGMYDHALNGVFFVIVVTVVVGGSGGSASLLDLVFSGIHQQGCSDQHHEIVLVSSSPYHDHACFLVVFLCVTGCLAGAFGCDPSLSLFLFLFCSRSISALLGFLILTSFWPRPSWALLFLSCSFFRLPSSGPSGLGRFFFLFASFLFLSCDRDVS